MSRDDPPEPVPERRDTVPVLPDVSRDETPEGWGEPRDDERDDDWYRRERPPHWE